MRLPLIFLISISLFMISQSSLVLAETLSTILEQNAKSIERPTRRKIGAIIDTLFASNAVGVPNFLKLWRDKRVWRRKQDGVFFFGPNTGGKIELTDIDTGTPIGTVSSREFKQIKPNSGVRSVINAVLVQFQLEDPDPEARLAAVRTLEQRVRHFTSSLLKVQSNPKLSRLLRPVKNASTIYY